MADMKLKTAFEIFGLPLSSTPKEVKRQYRKKARLYHPDKCKDKALAHKKFIALKSAYDIARKYVERNNHNREKTEMEIQADANQRQEARNYAVWMFFYENWMKEPEPELPALKAPPPEPNPVQWKSMDEKRVLSTILERIRLKAPSLPKNITRWYWLKEWLETHPVDGYSMEDIEKLQAVHCAHVTLAEAVDEKRAEQHPDEGGNHKRYDSDDESVLSSDESIIEADSDGFDDFLGFYDNGWGTGAEESRKGYHTGDEHATDPRVRSGPKEYFRKHEGFFVPAEDQVQRTTQQEPKPEFWW